MGPQPTRDKNAKQLPLETGYEAWLRYQPTSSSVGEIYRPFAQTILVNGASPVLKSAVAELERGISGMLDVRSTIIQGPNSASDSLVMGVIGQSPVIDEVVDSKSLSLQSPEGYLIQYVDNGVSKRIVIAGKTDVGCLYGVFHFLRLLQTGQDLPRQAIVEEPTNRLRMINHWDNMDGSIERGYAGRSLFYEGNQFTTDLLRIEDYARLLSSLRINALTINNVNVHQEETKLITEDYLPHVAKFADIFRAYGIQLFLSINFASPMQIGHLPTADPLSPAVRQWWADKVADIYRYIPDFGGFLVKADSEFRPGPFTYDRNHVDGANMLAEALMPFGGLLIWRCFVYNCVQDWRDRKTDRARAAYDHFKPYDGGFNQNVILQIKNGPMDFQVREPVSPLFGGLTETNQLLELQITQEYTGQQRHLCYLVPQWKEVLDFDTHAQGRHSTVEKIASGELYNRPYGGIAAVVNVGRDPNWTGHLLAQANLYGYGALCWNPATSSEEIAETWAKLTFGDNRVVIETVCDMLMKSWRIYENYTAPLGVGWMVNPNHHYGPNVDGYEYSKWGTYHYADCTRMGVDRTVLSGTGYAGQYHSPVADKYEAQETCPDDLLLFFHNVPYTHKLHSGKTVIQHIYDTHFDGAQQAQWLKDAWQSLNGLIDTGRFWQTEQRLNEQAQHATEWRDTINTYFARKSGIPDEQGRTIY